MGNGSSRNSGTWYNKGIECVALGRYEDSLKCFEKTVKIDRNNAFAWFNRGDVLIKLGRDEEALNCYNEVIKIDKHFVFGWNNNTDALVWNNKSVVLIHLGRNEDALKCCDKVLKIDGYNPLAWANKGYATSNLGKYEEALKYYDEAIKMDRNFTLAWSNKSGALIKLGRNEEALKCCEVALKIDENFAFAWINKGLAFFNLERYEEGLNCCDEALIIDNNIPIALNNKGYAYIKLGKCEEALKILDDALKIDYKKLDRTIASIWSNKGYALNELGKYEDALKCCDTALSIMEKHELAWNNKGFALNKLGRYEDGLRCCEEALRIKEDLDLAWNNKGESNEKLGNLEEAFTCYEKAIQLKVGSNFDEALEGKRRVVKLMKKNGIQIPISRETGKKTEHFLCYKEKEEDSFKQQALGPLIILRKKESLPSFKESVMNAFGSNFDEAFWIGNEKFWKDDFLNFQIINSNSQITFDEYLSISLYTMYPLKLYSRLNSALTSTKRSKTLPKWKFYLSYLIQALKKIDPWKMQQALYRAVRVNLVEKAPEKYVKDNIITWFGFSSATTSLAKANELLQDDLEGTIFTINGCFSGRTISEFSQTPDECSILIPPGSRFKIIGVSKLGHYHIIELQQIPTLETLIDLEPSI
jgi:tetratricopeptide (TPR) repeat protein